MMDGWMELCMLKYLSIMMDWMNGWNLHGTRAEDGKAWCSPDQMLILMLSPDQTKVS